MSQDSSQLSSSAETSWEDRRSSPRHKTDHEILWYLTAEKPVDKKTGRLVDLSISGAALKTSIQLSAGEPICLKLPPKEKVQATVTDGASVPNRSNTSLSVRGTIVNVSQMDDGDWRYGIKFERLYYTLANWANS